MIRLSVNKLKQGMVVAQSIYNNHGASYLMKGQPITAAYINLLEKLGRKKNQRHLVGTDIHVKFNEKRGKQRKVEGIMFHLTKVDTINHQTYSAPGSTQEENNDDSLFKKLVDDF